jgi:iron(III) transport system substrate-binding protein
LFKKVLALVVVAVAAVSVSGCTAEAALPDKSSIVVYAGRSEALIQPIVDQFTSDTGIAVEIRYAGSAELAAQLLEEGQNSPADIFFAQDAGALGAVAKAGLLTKLPDEILGLISPQYSAADGSWVGVSGRVRVLVYNPDNVDNVPSSVFELAEPEWQGRIGIAPTNASFQAFVTAMRVIHGEDKTLEWLRAMKTNGVIYEKNSAILEAVENKSVDAGLINHYYWFAMGREIGFENLTSRLGQFQARDVGNLINAAGVGIVSDSNAARSFVEYLLSRTGQQYFVDETSEYPLISGIEAGVDLTPLDQIPAPDIDLSDLNSLEETLKLIREAGLI